MTEFYLRTGLKFAERALNSNHIFFFLPIEKLMKVDIDVNMIEGHCVCRRVDKGGQSGL